MGTLKLREGSPSSASPGEEVTSDLNGSSTMERSSGGGGGLDGFSGAPLPFLSVLLGEEDDSGVWFGSPSQPQGFVNSYSWYF